MNNYFITISLLIGIVCGTFVGILYPHITTQIKPIGINYLNLLFMALVPFVFFTVSATFSQLKHEKSIPYLLCVMLFAFLLLSVIAAVSILFIFELFPMHLSTLDIPPMVEHQTGIINSTNHYLTVNYFYELFSHEHLLPLIIFASLVGVASLQLQANSVMKNFLREGEQIFINILNYILYLAPIGFFCYFAAMTAEAGNQIVGSYIYVTALYYLFSIIYIILLSYIINLLIGKVPNKLYWPEFFNVSLVALGSCSSIATIPVNLSAAKNFALQPFVYKTVIPLGSIINKNGTVVGAMLKIIFLTQIYHLPFNSPATIAFAILVAIIASIVMGAIPSGGMMGEMLIVSFYGLPLQALVLIVPISLLIDPLATVINSWGNTLACIIVNKFYIPKVVLAEP